MKDFDKGVRYRLHYKRVNPNDHGEEINQNLSLRGNFNILQEYLYVLTVFKTWEAYA